MPNSRQTDLAKIHIAKKDLCLTQADYEAVLRYVSKGRTASSAELTGRERTALLKHFWQKGWRSAHTKNSQAATMYANSPEAKKVRALWLLLNELGQVRDPSERALAAYCKRNLGVDALHFTDQLWRLIEGLKDWAMRVLPQVTKAQEQQLCNMSLPARQPKNIACANFDEYLSLYQAQKAALRCAQQEVNHAD